MKCNEKTKSIKLEIWSSVREREREGMKWVSRSEKKWQKCLNLFVCERLRVCVCGPQACTRVSDDEKETHERRRKKSTPQTVQEATRSHILARIRRLSIESPRYSGRYCVRRMRVCPQTFRAKTIRTVPFFMRVPIHSQPSQIRHTHTHTRALSGLFFFLSNFALLIGFGLKHFCFSFHNTLSYTFEVDVHADSIRIDGCRVAYMRDRGVKFFAVRVSATLFFFSFPHSPALSHRLVFVPFICIPIPNWFKHFYYTPNYTEEQAAHHVHV